MYVWMRLSFWGFIFEFNALDQSTLSSLHPVNSILIPSIISSYDICIVRLPYIQNTHFLVLVLACSVQCQPNQPADPTDEPTKRNIYKTTVSNNKISTFLLLAKGTIFSLFFLLLFLGCCGLLFIVSSRTVYYARH